MRRNFFFALVMLVTIAPVGCQTMGRALVGMDEAYNSPERVESRKLWAQYDSEMVTGTTRQCFYKLSGAVYTKTVRSTQICPLSIPDPR